MLRMLRVLCAVGLLTIGAVSGASAQSKFFSVGLGATMPSGDFGEYANTGWMASAGVGSGIGSGNMFISGNVFMGKNAHDAGDLDEDVGSTTLTGVGANVGMMTSGAMKFYGQVGIGMMQHKYNPPEQFEGECDDCSDTKMYFGGAVGALFGSGKKQFFAQAGLMSRSGDEGDGTQFLTISAGLRFGF